MLTTSEAYFHERDCVNRRMRDMQQQYDLNDTTLKALLPELTQVYNRLYEMACDGREYELWPSMSMDEALQCSTEALAESAAFARYSRQSRDRDMRQDYMRCFLEILDALGLLRIADRNVFFWRRVASDFLSNRLYGVSTAIRGLDFLLNGGLDWTWKQVKKPLNSWRRKRRGLVLRIHGGMGTGKTTLALQIASAIAREGRFCLYVALEEPIRSLKDKVGAFGWNVGSRFVILETTYPGHIPAAAHEGKGVLLFASQSTENRSPVDGEKSPVQSPCDALAKMIGSLEPEAVLVDSVNAFSDMEATEEGRKGVRDFLYSLTERGVLGVCISEDRPGAEGLSDYLAFLCTASIKLSSKPDKSEQVRRVIEIEKCRQQFHYRGEHVFEIKPGCGFLVFPSPSAKLTWWQQSEVPRRWGNAEFGINGLNDMLGGGVREGSVTALVGDSGTARTAIGLHFLAAGLPGENIAMISFRLDQETILRQCRNFPRLTKVIKREHILYTRPHYHMASHALEWVEEYLDGQRRAGQPVRRVLIDDLSQLKLRFPMLAADNIFLAALIDLLRAYGATTVVIDHLATDSAGRAVNPVLDIAENAILTYRRTIFGTTRTVVDVGRLGVGSERKRPAELRCESGRLEVVRSLDGITGILEGHAQRVRLSLSLYQETAAQEDSNGEIERVVNKAFGADVQRFGPFPPSKEARSVMQSADEVYESLVLGGGILREGTIAVALDEYWLSRLKGHENLLLPVPENLSLGFEEEFLKETVSEKIKGNDHFLAVPFYLNFSVLCYRKDLLSERDLPKSWDDVKIQADKALSRAKKLYGPTSRLRPLYAFDYSGVGSESLNCLVLEILQEKALCYPSADAKEVDLKRIAEALLLLRELLCPKDHRPDRRNSGLGAGSGSPRAVFWRHWFTTACDMLDKHPELQGRVGVAPLPGGRGTYGDWYLGVLRESVESSTGWKAIRAITEPAIGLARFQRGVGLPPFKRFYDLGLPLPYDMTPSLRELSKFYQHKAMLSRAKIPDYGTVSKALQPCVLRLVDYRERITDKNEAVRMLKGVCQQIKTLGIERGIRGPMVERRQRKDVP